MRPNPFKLIRHIMHAALGLLLLSSATVNADVNLQAGPATAALPDGQGVPMWGYTCGASTAGETCAALNPNAGGNWSPVVITIPYTESSPGVSTTSLTINLTNHLPAGIPTSLVIVGQLGGGLGTNPRPGRADNSPAHPPQGPTWPIAGPAGGDNPTFVPPAQVSRVRSFGTEVAAGSSQSLTWTSLKPGTYLIESGSHPSIQGPMGLYGMLVVTTPDASGSPPGSPGTAYPGVTYDADVPLLLSEIDAVQNRAVDTALHTAGFSETKVWNGQAGQCGDPAVHSCYPPAVNYDPRYYLVNGISFDRNNQGNSTQSILPTPATATHGSVLLRFVNAGLRMHVPSVVGADMKLIAEDGNILPGIPKTQNEVFLPAGKTYDVSISPPATGGAYKPGTFPIFDRQLSLSTNNQRDGGMQSYVNVAGGAAPSTPVPAMAVADTYSVVSGNTLSVTDPAKGVIANDVGIYGVKVSGSVPAGLTLNPNGTFTYNGAPTTFSYCGNGATSGALCTTVTLAACTGTCLGASPTANDDTYTSNVAARLEIKPSGVLANDTDPDGHPLTAQLVGSATGGSVTLNADGSFVVTPTVPPVAPATSVVTFQYNAVNSQNTSSASPATVTVTFNGGSGLAVTLKDGPTGTAMPNDYRWIIEEDRTFKIDPATQTNNGGPPVPALGTNFHTSYMPVIAQGCVGTVACESGQTLLGAPAVCDQGNGVCRTDASQQTAVSPSQVALDPTKRYYISIVPGDAANPFNSGAGSDPATDCGPYSPGGQGWDPSNPAASGSVCGHAMGGAPIAPAQTSVDVILEQTPLPTAKITVFVFEDDQPLNGENDAGGGIDVLAPNEAGLGGFEITLFDQAGGLGDATGQITYDMFNMPVSNSLAGTIDPSTGLDACPISKKTTDPTQQGVVGMIVTCPKYEAGKDGTATTVLSPLAGQAVIANMYPGLYEVVATPAAERIAKGEEWLQTNTLDGTKPLEAFIKPGEPAYFQEFGPAGFHVSIGFANPAIINARKAQVCATQSCLNSVTGQVTTSRLSRTPDQRLYSSGSYDANSFTQCYVSLGDPDDEDFAFTKCNPDGTFTLSGLPDGNWRITVFDQWNDLLVDGLSTPVALGPNNRSVNMGDIPMQHWRTNMYTRTFFDQNGDGVSQDNEPGLALVPTNIRYRDGSIGFFNNTDLDGFAGFNEIFPFANWLVLEADTARYKQTGVHVVYDAGGPADGTPGGGSSVIGAFLANTLESPTAHLPANLRVPGAQYCNDADCTDRSGTNPSTGRVDPPWVTTEAWQGLLGQAQFIEFGKKPFEVGENGGIRGEVNYASTRPFDDPALLLQLSWAPNIPNVTVNLYQKSTAPDGTESLKLVDTTKTSSWDDWAQGFRSDGNPNMNCPGQETTSPFYYTLLDSQQYLNPGVTLPNHSQFKCYDGWAIHNQVQPAPYDGMYQFPSVTARNPTTGQPTGTNCAACITGPDGNPMLPAGKYVVEVIVPPGYELVKEEDKNILIGDNYIAPVVQQFGGLGSIFILPDQAAMNATNNPVNPLNPTTDLGATPRHEGDTGSVETFWPCVGAKRIVPDWLSEFPAAEEVAPFAGASRNLCDRKEVTLEDQMTANAKFYLFSSTHVTAHFTGVVNDDFASEFDPFSPQYGEKFAVPNLPISIKDWTGKEISRVYADQWGTYNGVTYSSWSPNPPNPTGYAPAVMVMCMNDPGTGPTPDPLYNSNYSTFCYEWSFMPGQTNYLDTPVVPTAAFADAYNTADCAYPDTTPAISEVDGTEIGPWVGDLMGVTSLTLANGGSGYTSVPVVGFSGGTGSNATATATMRLTGITLTNGGSGYTSVPTVDFTNGGSGSGAAASATMRVGSVVVTNPGSGYTTRPAVSVGDSGSGTGSGTGTGTGTGSGGSLTVVSLNFRNLILGSCANGNHDLIFTGGGGSGGAAGTATISNRRATGFNLTSGGSYNTAPSVRVAGCNSVRATATMGNGSTASTGGSSGSTATGGASLAAASLTVVSLDNFQNRIFGTCANGNHDLIFTGGGGSGGAAGTVAVSNRRATGFNLASGGSYDSPPTVRVAGCNNMRATAKMGVGSIVVAGGGSNYTTPPAISIASPPAGAGNVGATAAATLSVDSVSLTASGSGYVALPAVTFSGGGGSGATANVTMSVDSLTLTSGGQYTLSSATPTVTFTAASGSGASATVTLAAVATVHTLTINALGDKQVPNPAYSGPQATAAPFNQKMITRHYGFGDRPGTCPDTGACPNVTVAGIPLTDVSTWTDAQIIGTVPDIPEAASTCKLQQRNEAPAQCGELEITIANGKKTVDTVTVTVGGKPPTLLSAGQTIQSAIDAATPGDLIMIPPGTYNEMLLMWKPVRLQGVGAASSIINANSHPAGLLLDPWRRKVSCLFGIALNGQPISDSNPYDPTGTYSCDVPSVTDNPMTVDRLPLEAVLGWDTTLNGNLAELLAEPTLMGAYEGAGITVLAKGVRYDCSDPTVTGGCPWGNGELGSSTTAHEGQMPVNTVRLTNSDKDCNDFPSNFLCNPSRIDGLTVTNSSQGGGGIFAHGWAHNLEVSNDRVYANIGTLTGGITIGQGEFPDAYVAGNNGDPLGFDQAPWTCVPGAQSNPNPPGFVTGTQLPYCLNTNTSLHNNSITRNSSIGDELYSSTPTAAGGVTFTTGSDYYHFNQNWVCGNLSTGDGGGVVHSGFSYNGDISRNWIIFNQSNNPTIPTYGGGLGVLAAAPDANITNNGVALECGSVTDADCAPALADGTGPGLVIDSNLIMGNTAESGSGGGIRLQGVNGTEVGVFPRNPERWNDVTVTNNIIANNVAGWDGGGVSMQDALKVKFINNTVISNDTTASAGVLFNTLGAPLSSNPTTPCNTQTGVGCTSTSTNQPAGLVTMRNTTNLTASLPPNGPGTQVTCPSGYGYGSSLNDGSCRQASLPLMRNNLFWQNRAFHLDVHGNGPGLLNQQNLVTLVPQLDQTATGQCLTTGANGTGTVSYWDIGVRGDTGPTNHGSGFSLSPSNSILTSLSGGYSGNGNIAPNSPGVVSQYCNGARVPPENGGMGFNVDPGIADATSPNPIFNLTPSATVDEGNNWINMMYGPLSLNNASTYTAPNIMLAMLGDYSIQSGTPPVDNGSASGAPDHDIFGTHRPQGNGIDIGAVELPGASGGGGGGGGGGGLPALSVLDDFNRATGVNLGSNWSQATLGSLAAIAVFDTSNGDTSTGVAQDLLVAGSAYWNGTGNVFGSTQGAAFTFASSTGNNSALVLKASNGTASAPTQYIRVRFTTSGTDRVIVETTTNGSSFTAQGSAMNTTFASGDTFTAVADATGLVSVWKNTTLLGTVQLPTTGSSSWTTGGGRIGMQLPGGGRRVDNFAGGNVP